jgi:hypothetical protein
VTSKLWQLPEEEKRKHPKVIGVIPDLHFPFSKKEYLDFLVKTFKSRKVTDIVFIGDMIDNYTLSKFGAIPEALNALEEKRTAQYWVNKYIAEFPIAKFIIGNHEQRIEKRLAEIGIPREFLKSFKDLFFLPNTWEIGDYFIIDGVHYSHGTGFSGQHAAVQNMMKNRVSSVMGHTHTFGGVVYSNNGIDTAFALNVGSLLDDQAYAFAYSKYNRQKPTLGCGVVYSTEKAEFIPYVEESKGTNKGAAGN